MYEYYNDNKLKQQDARPSKFVDFEDIAKHHNVNIMLFESQKDSMKETESVVSLWFQSSPLDSIQK